MYSLAEALGASGYEVIVLCPLPNYPNGRIFEDYRGKLYNKEKQEFGWVHHLWLLPSNSKNKLIRLLAMITFSVSLCLYFLFKKTPKKILIQYSPIFVGYTGVWLGRLFSKKTILNVSDLWPLAGKEMGVLSDGFYYNRLLRMEKFCYKNSDLIVGQSNEILDYISKFNLEKPLFLYRNFPNFKTSLPATKQDQKEIRIVYAGLLGIAQGILNICNEIRFPEHVSLHIYGAGPEAEIIKDSDFPNVFFHGEVERAVLHQELQQYDLAFIPLIKRIYGSVPSKIFEYSKLSLPILYFGGGEGEDIVSNHKLGWVVNVENEKELQNFIDTLTLGKLNNFPKDQVQKNAIQAFDFKRQFEEFEKTIQSL